MRTSNLIVAGLVAMLGVALVYGLVEMTVNCIYINEGESLRLRYKGPLLFGSGKAARAGQFAEGWRSRRSGRDERAGPPFLLSDLVGAEFA